WLFLIPIGFVLILSVGSVPPKVPSVASGLLLIFLYCSLLLPGLQNLWHCLALRALLKNSSRTTEKMTLAERLNPREALYSVEYLIFLLMLFLVIFFGMLFFSAHR